MKILIFTSVIPYPLDEGGKTAQFVFLQSLVKDHTVLLVVPPVNVKQQQDIEQLQSSLPKLRIAALEDEPLKKKSLKIRIIEKLIWELKKMLPPEPEANEVYKNEFFMHPVRVRKPHFIRQILSIVATEQPDLVQIDFVDNADIGIALPSTQKKILILHDLRFASVAQAASIRGFEAPFVEYMSEVVKLSELSYLQKFDGLVTFSEDDAQKLLKASLKNVFVSPFAVSSNCFVPLTESYTIKKLVFIGPDHHYPNFDAVMWYANDFSKIIKKQFGLELTVIGKWSNKNKERFTNFPDVKFAGFVADLATEVKDAIMLVPLRIGSGIRTKILEAFAMGVPVISTTVGCEGIGARHDEEILIGADVYSFVLAIERLILDKELLSKLRRNAQAFVMHEYAPEAVYKRRMEIYQNLRS